MMRKLRMVNVVLAANFVVDDGTDLTPLQPQQWPITAAEWPSVIQKVSDAMAEMQQALDTEDTPQPNRAARRAGTTGKAKSSA